MNSNANKVVLAVAIATIVAVLAFIVVGLGSCSQISEVGSSAPVAGGDPAEAGYDADAGLSETDDDGGYDYTPSTSEDAAPDVTLDEYRAMLEKDAAPTGVNARDAARSENVPPVSEVYPLSQSTTPDSLNRTWVNASSPIFFYNMRHSLIFNIAFDCRC